MRFPWFFRKLCPHQFPIEWLRFTDIPEPIKPDANGRFATYDDWSNWYNELYNGQFMTHRIEGVCVTCKGVYYAHCGLSLPGRLIRTELPRPHEVLIGPHKEEK
jgi:hypothetical protein